MEPTTSSFKGNRGRTLRTCFCCVAAALAVLAFYTWTVQTSGESLKFDGPKADYYNLLSHGFLDGHTYMKVPVDPALLALPQSQRPGSAPYLLDASLYGDHYYLYFGPIPVVALLLPFRLLFGTDLPLGVATLLFYAGAFGVGVALWLRLARRYFPDAGVGTHGVAILTLGLSTVAASALRRPGAYEEAIGAGYLFNAFMLLAIFRAWENPSRRFRWLALAGFAAGCAVGSRANLAVGDAMILAIAATGCARISRSRGEKAQQVLLTSLTIIVLTGGAIAVSLAIYNKARFGSYTEIGHTYQLGTNPKQLFRGTNLIHNAKLYYFSRPAWNAYFPYVLPPSEGPKPVDYTGREQVHGEWIWLIVVALMLISLVCPRGRRDVSIQLTKFAGLLVLGFLIHFAVVALTGLRANRYMVDFHPWLVLATLLMLIAATQSDTRWNRVLRPLAMIALIASAFYNIFASITVHGFFQRGFPEAYENLAARMDRLTWPVMPVAASRIGDRLVDLHWPTITHGRPREPLLVVGTNQMCDAIWIDYDDHRARFVYRHDVEDEAYGEWFDIAPGARSFVRISGGPLVPAADHPWFSNQGSSERKMLKRRLRIAVDDKVHYNRDVRSFDCSPNLQAWGENRDPVVGNTRFGGVISHASRRPLEARWATRELRDSGPIRVRCHLSEVAFGRFEPLLSVTSESGFDLIGIHYTRPGYIQIVHDHQGSGATKSDEFPVDYSQIQSIEIETFGHRDRERLIDARTVDRTIADHAVHVFWNGQEVFKSSERLYSDDFANFGIGVNEGRSSAASTVFFGPLFNPLYQADLGSLGPGAMDAVGDDTPVTTFPRGTLLRFHRSNGATGALLWNRENDGLRFYFYDHNNTFVSAGLTKTALNPMGLHFELQGGAATFTVGHETVLRAITPFFEDTAVEVSGSENTWTGPSLQAPASTSFAEASESPAELWALPGRVRIRFLYPSAGFVKRGFPLLCAGKTGAGDLIYIICPTPHTVQVGLDIWGSTGVLSEPVDFDVSRIHTAIIELGNMFADGGYPPDRARVVLDGRTVIDTHGPLHRVMPKEISIAANPIGMSTGTPLFPGVIVSVRTGLPANSR